LREPERFGAWIAGIARHVARERRRALRRDRHEFVGNRCQENLAEDDGHARAEAERLQAVLESVRALDEREQLAVHAFFLEGRDVRATSKLLGLSRSGAYALIARAVARLAAMACAHEKQDGSQK
jgi:RNA polymerase sigma factor (sigma-70 family)